MRCYYLADLPAEAWALLKNPKATPLFDQFISYQILMDKLLENKMYDEVLDVFSLLTSRCINGNKFPKQCFTLVIAALFRKVQSCLFVIEILSLTHYLLSVSRIPLRVMQR